MARGNTKLNQLHQDSRALLEQLADRIPTEQAKSLRSFSKAGEWGELVDSLCATLVKRKIPITEHERDALAELLAMFDTSSKYHNFINDKQGTLAALTISPQR